MQPHSSIGSIVYMHPPQTGCKYVKGQEQTLGIEKEGQTVRPAAVNCPTWIFRNQYCFR